MARTEATKVCSLADKDLHLGERCGHRSVRCPDCNEEFLAEELEKHQVGTWKAVVFSMAFHGFSIVFLIFFGFFNTKSRDSEMVAMFHKVVG